MWSLSALVLLVDTLKQILAGCRLVWVCSLLLFRLSIFTAVRTGHCAAGPDFLTFIDTLPYCGSSFIAFSCFYVSCKGPVKYVIKTCFTPASLS